MFDFLIYFETFTNVGRVGDHTKHYYYVDDDYEFTYFYTHRFRFSMNDPNNETDNKVVHITLSSKEDVVGHILEIIAMCKADKEEVEKFVEKDLKEEEKKEKKKKWWKKFF